MMDPGRIDPPPALTRSRDYHWTRILVQWMGRLWSLSSFKLMALITRISCINCFFHSTPLSSNEAGSTPLVVYSPSTEMMMEFTPVVDLIKQPSDRSPPAPPSPIHHSPHLNKGYVMIEAGSGGNCMLLSIALDLRLKKFEKPYTHRELRQLGVAYVRTEISSNGPHAQILRGYVDADRSEHNRLNPNQKIDSHDQFLQLLEQDGFPCSGTHLFSLSYILNIPIYIFNAEGTRNHKVQLLNPRNADNTNAIVVGLTGSHYRLIVPANIYTDKVLIEELKSLAPSFFSKSP